MIDEIKEHIWNEVWFGINPKEYIKEQVYQNFLDEEAADEESLNIEIDRIMQIKSSEEKQWKAKEETDFYKLSRAIDNLHLDGIIAVHNAGFTQDDCLNTIQEVYDQVDTNRIIGYCFYNEQDITRLIPAYGSENTSNAPDDLLLSFGAFSEVSSDQVNVARYIIARLRHFGLKSEWDGDTNHRIVIKNFSWQKRLDNNDWTGYRSAYFLKNILPKHLAELDKTNTQEEKSNSQLSKKRWQFWKR